jgi:carbon-monoxide dehydrogenase medium subunit
VTPFELVEPATLREAVAVLDPEDVSVRAIAGGTALMLLMKVGIFKPTRLVSLRKVEARFGKIELDEDGSLRIGALAALSDVERSPLVAANAPVVTQTLHTLSNVRVRNVATLGGHLAHADPHMDLPPVLMTLGARVFAVGPGGERWIDVRDLFAGYYETTLAPNELIAEVMIPPQTGRHAAYVKCTTLSADDWPALGVAASLRFEGGTIVEASLAVSAATEKPTPLLRVAELVRGRTPDEATLREAGEAAVAEVEIIPDGRGSVAYKRQLLRVYVGRALRAAYEKAMGL